MQKDDSVTQEPQKCCAAPLFYHSHGNDTAAEKGQSVTPVPLVSRRHARLNPNCVVCGVRNPRGLRLTFQEGLNGVHSLWVPAEGWESFQGTVHGGIITAVLDEAMSKAVIARNWEALTVDLRVRFHGRVTPGENLRVHGWVVEKQRRRILTEATLINGTGVERAHAWAKFLVPRV